MQEASTSWQFDMFAFAEATPGYTLSLLALHLHKQTGLINEFKISEQPLCRWLRRIESGYNANNPYHNRSAIDNT